MNFIDVYFIQWVQAYYCYRIFFDAQISPDLASIPSALNYEFPDLKVLHWSLYVVGEVSGMSVMFCGI